jgi:hypothetical protein
MALALALCTVEGVSSAGACKVFISPRDVSFSLRNPFVRLGAEFAPSVKAVLLEDVSFRFCVVSFDV